MQPDRAIMESKPSKDKWDIIEILARPISAMLTAITIALIGYIGQDTLTKINSQQENSRAKIAAEEQDARLYTQLLSSREAAESALRKDMFKEIMDGFFMDIDIKDNAAEFDPAKNAIDIENQISKKLLKLEMLALNVGDSLSLGPLFSEVSKDIERILKSHKDIFEDWIVASSTHRKRLHSLAKRVASAQLSTIAPKGEVITIRVPYENIEKQSANPNEEWQYTWPYDDKSYGATSNPLNVLPHCREFNNSAEKCTPKRSITIQLRNASYKKKSVQINLIIESLDETKITEVEPTKINFKLDYFNFPLIDNTRLSNNERFAIILEDFDAGEVVLKGVLFPGVYASQRDKPYLNEAIQDLKIQKNLTKKQLYQNTVKEAP